MQRAFDYAPLSVAISLSMDRSRKTQSRFYGRSIGCFFVKTKRGNSRLRFHDIQFDRI
ncbi:hypothetical protein LEP1GSC168_1624 [Leptospira santarosai str. HAI134]|nr:hypothetical protein LEP1GSC168_1624 [Leptospira santarosai str. HAI134]